jgi:hypothetical protein
LDGPVEQSPLERSCTVFAGNGVEFIGQAKAHLNRKL